MGFREWPSVGASQGWTGGPPLYPETPLSGGSRFLEHVMVDPRTGPSQT